MYYINSKNQVVIDHVNGLDQLILLLVGSEQTIPELDNLSHGIDPSQYEDYQQFLYHQLGNHDIEVLKSIHFVKKNVVHLITFHPIWGILTWPLSPDAYSGRPDISEGLNLTETCEMETDMDVLVYSKLRMLEETINPKPTIY